LKFSKDYWKRKQGSDLSPWQGALCGSLAGGIAASITTPLGFYLFEFYFILFNLF
jgi:solute carrier family 25 S-adenosylmethionine transporter 26